MSTIEDAEVSITLRVKEWKQIIERVEDDDFYRADGIAQDAIVKIKNALNVK